MLRILYKHPALWTVPLAITPMIVVSDTTALSAAEEIPTKMLVLHAPEKLGLKQEYVEEHQAAPATDRIQGGSYAPPCFSVCYRLD